MDLAAPPKPEVRVKRSQSITGNLGNRHRKVSQKGYPAHDQNPNANDPEYPADYFAPGVIVGHHAPAFLLAGRLGAGLWESMYRRHSSSTLSKARSTSLLSLTTADSRILVITSIAFAISFNSCLVAIIRLLCGPTDRSVFQPTESRSR
ncbi:uncharacterized protein Dvar_08550 [Desulfosarcina variabilis str. Montpellier]